MANDKFAGLDDAVGASLHETTQNTAAQVRNNVVSSVGVNPDQEAQYKHLAAFVGVPIDTVRADPDAIKQQAAVQQMDAGKLVQDYPHTARFMVANPFNTNIMHDDVPGTAAVEQAASGIPRPPAPVQETGKSVGTSLLGAPLAAAQGLGGAFSKAAGAVNLVLGAFPTMYDKAASLVTGAPTTAASDAWFKAMVDPRVNAAPDYELGQNAGFPEKAAHTAGSLIGMLSQITLAGTGAPAAGAVDAAMSTPAFVAGAVEHGAKSMMFPALADAVDTGRRVHAATGDAAAAARAAQMQYLTTTSAGVVPLNAPGALATRLMTGFGSGAATSEINRQLMNSAMPVSMQQPFNAEDLILGGLTGSIMGGVMGPRAQPAYHDAIRETYIESAKADQAQKTGDMLQALGEAASASKLRERDPAAFREFVQNITDDGALHEVYIKAEDLQNALDQSGVDKAALAERMPALAGQLHEALQTQGDVMIPVADYATHFAGGPLDAALLPHLKGAPDGMTYKEGQQYFQNETETMKAQAEKMAAAKQADDAHDADKQAVYDHIFGQLETAGRYSPDVNKAYASLTRDFYATTAARLGITPSEALARYPLEVKADALAGAKTLDQAGALENGTVPLHTFFGKGDGAPVISQALEDGGRADTEKNPDVPVGEPVSPKSDGVVDVPPLLAVLAHVRRAALIDPQILDAIVDSVPIDVVNSLFGSKGAAKVALHDEPMFKAGFTVDADLAVPGGLGDATHPVGLLVREAALMAAERDGASSGAGSKAAKEGSAKSAGDGNSLGQDKTPGKRASLSFGDDITKQPSIISLLAKADLTSFLHESGHFYLEVQNDIARRADAPADIKADMQTTLDWFGVKDREAWNAMTLDEKRESHEKFARGFESYLMEGKAPTVELQGLFSRFRSWLVSVYQSLGSLNVDLTPEVRSVFDRMLATDEAIKQTEQTRGYMALFPTADAAGMTPEAFAAYQNLGVEATQAATATMEARSLRDMKWLSNAKAGAMKALQKEAAAERIKIRDQVTAEVMAEPVNRARAYLKTGKLTGADGVELPDTRPLGAPAVKLDKEALAAMYPKGALGAPDLAKLRGLTGAGGMHPDMVAEMFGMNSGHELVRQLTEGENAKDKIKGLTDQRMLEQHGDLVDPVSIERAAEEAVHNEGRARFMATGLKILTKSPLPAGQIARAAKDAAETAVAAKKVGELRPAQYAAAEGRANKEALKLAPKDPEAAAQAQRAALLNNRLFRATTDAVTESQKAVKYLARFSKDSVRGLIDIDIRDQIDALLARFDLRQKVPTGPTRPQMNLQTWIESQRDAGYQPAFTADMIDPTVREHFADMTVERLRGLRDTVAALEHIGKERKSILIDGERVDVDELVKNEMIPKMQERGTNFTPEQLLDRPEDRHTNPVALALDKMGARLRAIQAQLKPQEFKRNMFDNHDLLGPFGRAIFDRVFAANYRKVDMLKALSDDYQRTVQDLGRDWQKSLVDQVDNTRLPDPDKPGQMMRISRGKMIGIAIHVGNESNFDKITRGWDWKPEQVWGFLHDNMTEKDWKAVRSVWDQYEKHFPDMQAMSRRLGNTSPDKIEPRPFNTKFGEMKGGYAAIKYDSLRSRRGEKEAAGQAINSGDALFTRDYFRSDTTTNGAMNARIDGYTDRVDLDFHHIARSLHDSIHDLAYREALIDSNKIIEHGEFRKQFKATYGPEAYQSLRDWIGQTANAENFDRQAGALGQFLAYTRTGIVMTGIALRVSTILKHGGSAGIKTMGYFTGGGEKYLLSRFASMGTDYKNQIAGAREKFPEIRARWLQQDRDYRVTASSLFEPESLTSKAERFGHAGVAWSDMMTAAPTAWAAYDRAISEGIPKNQGGTGAPMTEAQAVAYASKIVREAHGSNIETARSMALNTSSEALKMFTTLYGFMNTTYGQALDGWDKLHTAGISNPAVLARSFMALIVPAIWAHALTHGGPGDEEGWAAWVGKAIAGEVAGMVPFVRDAASMVQGYAHAGQVGVESWMNTMVKAGGDVVALSQGKEVHAPIKDIANAAGMGLHIPGLGQLGTSAQYIADVQAGKQHPENAGQYVKGVLLGPPKKH